MATQQPGVQKKKLTLSFENYKQISNMLILHIRSEETRAEAEGEVSKSSDGLKRSDIVNWYLQECADDIESEEDLIERKSLAEKVLDRLCYHVSRLLFIVYLEIGIVILILLFLLLSIHRTRWSSRCEQRLPKLELMRTQRPRTIPYWSCIPITLSSNNGR